MVSCKKDNKHCCNCFEQTIVLESLEGAERHLRSVLGFTANIVTVTSADHPAVSPYRMKKVRNHTLASQQKRKMLDAKENWVVAVTTKVVHRALRGNYRVISLLLSCDPQVILFLESLVTQKYAGYTIYIAQKPVLHEIIGISLNKALAAAALLDVPQKPLNLSLLPSNNPRFLILDDVRSSENIGSILRLAFSLGLSYVVCSPTSFYALNSRSARVSMGALFHFHIFCTENMSTLLHDLHNHGITTIGTSPTATQTLQSLCTSDVLNRNGWALLLGNEDEGSSSTTLMKCDFSVCIPQVQGDSLSVVTSGAICLYELCKPHLYPSDLTNRVFIPDLP